MLQRFVFAMVVVFFAINFAYSETFIAMITKVEGNKVTFKKATYKPGGEAGMKYSYDKPVTVEATKDVAITRGHFSPSDPGTSKAEISLKTFPVEGGLSNEAFRQIGEGKLTFPSLITIADDGANKGKITAINLWRSASPK